MLQRFNVVSCTCISQIDCTAETSQCSTHGVSGYPTLKIFKSGEKTEDYNGPRDAGEYVFTFFNPSEANGEYCDCHTTHYQ